MYVKHFASIYKKAFLNYNNISKIKISSKLNLKCLQKKIVFVYFVLVTV